MPFLRFHCVNNVNVLILSGQATQISEQWSKRIFNWILKCNYNDRAIGKQNENRLLKNVFWHFYYFSKFIRTPTSIQIHSLKASKAEAHFLIPTVVLVDLIISKFYKIHVCIQNWPAVRTSQLGFWRCVCVWERCR